MNKVITCPSGLSGEIRGLTGKSFEMLTDRTLQRSGLLVDKLLAACWLGTADAGPYQFEGAMPDWQRVLAGDRFYAVMQIRVAMYGANYTFQTQCKSPDCRHPHPWTVDLENELAVRKFAPADLEAFQNGNKIEDCLPDGRRFWFRLATGADEVKIARFADQMSAFIPAVVARLHAIDGLPEAWTMRKFLENEDVSVAFEILRTMDRHDGGIDTSFMIECPRCGGVREAQIPFDRGFLVPKLSSGMRTAPDVP